MRYVITVLLVLLALFWLWPPGTADQDADVGGAVVGLLAAVAAAFRWYAVLDHAIEERLWRVMSDEWLPVLGLLKCFFLVLALWGVYALRILRRITRRVL